MKLSDITLINLKKLKVRTGKALFLIIPIGLLVTLSIVVSSQVKNFRTAAEQSIFGTIDEQSRLIGIKKEITFDRSSGPRSFFSEEDTQYSETDLAKIKEIPNVESAAINSPVPVSNVETEDLFEGITVNLGNLTGLDESTAALYTESDFKYEEGKAIPIILNARTFIENYEDWGGKTEIEIQMRGPGGPGAGSDMSDIEDEMPMKRRAISYDKDQLIDAEITVKVGGLSDLETSTRERGTDGMIMRKLTEDEIAENEDERKETISEYWNYKKISTPLEYTFVVVGVIEDESNESTYIPEEFATTLMHDYVQHQLDARNSTEIPTDYLNTTFTGLTYDGLELQSGTFSMGGFRMGEPGGGPGGQTQGSQDPDEPSYAIPGLVIELSDDGSEDVIGVYENADVYNEAAKSGDSISIKVASIYDRAQVIEDLNDAGYAYQDISNLNVFDNLENTLKKVTTALVVAFVVLTIAVIILTMSKFVSESTKEIGIFRAIGVTKMDIKKLFVSQALLYTLVGYAAGAIVGLVLNLILASAMRAWFDRLIGNTIEETFNVVNQIDSSVFIQVDWQSLGTYSVVLLGITLIISLIPATKASSVSPVEAIRGE